LEIFGECVSGNHIGGGCGGSLSAHLPNKHIPRGHALPHPPQLKGLKYGFTHKRLQQRKLLNRQLTPQNPQLFISLVRSTQRFPQHTLLGGNSPVLHMLGLPVQSSGSI
jgi:hypothetical protein